MSVNKVDLCGLAWIYRPRQHVYSPY